MSRQHQLIVNGDKDEFEPAKWSSNSQDGLPKRHPETHVNVLIVGAGIAGLMAALECWRKGHNVVGILERSQGPTYAGDLIIIQPSAMSIFRHWPDMCRELEEGRVDAPTYYRKHDGELIYGPTGPTFNDPEHLAEREGLPFVAPVQVRKRFYRMLLRQVARVGLAVDYGRRVERYFEDEAAGLGGVALDDGSVRVAHLVLAADGFKSRSELLIGGAHTPARSSGMSVYRTAYPRALAMRDETVRKRWGGIGAAAEPNSSSSSSPTSTDSGEERSRQEFWLGPGMHMVTFVSPDVVGWGLTPRDQGLLPGGAEPVESWDPDVDPADVVEVLRRVPGWDPAVEALVRTAPRGAVVHWPLLWRDLRREWTSAAGRVVQLGDAAHASVPSSGSGGAQAIEDAVTLAACLQLACMSSGGGGPGGAPLAARIYNLLRYERASCAQKVAFVNSQLTGATDWDSIRKKPERIRLRFPKWFFRHDPEAYAYEKYGQAFAHLVAGAEFKNTNYPPGHKFVPWTIEEVHRDISEGKTVEDLLDGDWS